ncbi:MAG: DNA polymerase III subunit gamma and tau [Actinomycetia bacterium]|nr:DNA polymerase III subunit gamma and tau [Actinomycetes bacterium]
MDEDDALLDFEPHEGPDLFGNLDGPEPQQGPDLFGNLDEPAAEPSSGAVEPSSAVGGAETAAVASSASEPGPEGSAASEPPVTARGGAPSEPAVPGRTAGEPPAPNDPVRGGSAPEQAGAAGAAEGALTLPAAPLALYRRYRPDVFADVIGQEHVTEPLQRALANNRVNHAYLFSGPRGCGKTTSARILARALNCAAGPTPEPCGKCRSCRDLSRGGPGSIDVIEIDAASHGGVDDARDLRERAFFAPVHSRYKIYIVDEAHMVTAAGFNALLKVVEEPPPHVKFIFATTEPEKVIGTIRSRTHHYPFRLVPPKVLSGYLAGLCEAEGVQVSPAVLPLVVRAGAGSVRDSLSVLDQLLGGAGPDGVTYQQAVGLLGFTPDSLLDEMVDAFAAGDGAGVFATIDRVVEVGQDPRRFAEDLLRRLRDLVIVAAVPDAVSSGLVDVAGDQAERLAVQAQGLGPGELTRAAEVIAQGLVEMRGTTAPRLHLELMSARVLLPGADQDGRGLHARLDRLERRLGMPSGPGAAPPGASTGDWVSALAGTPTQPSGAFSRPAPAGAREHPGTAGRSGEGEPRAGRSEGRPAEPSGPQRSGAEGPRTETHPERGPAEAPATATARPGPAPAPRPSRSPAGYLDEPPPDDEFEPPADRDQATLKERPVRPAEPVRSAGPGHPARPAGPRPGPGATGPEVSSGGVSAADVRRLWPEVLSAVMKRRRVTWMRLKEHAQVTEVRDGALVLAFSNDGIREQFARGGHEDILRDALVDVMGADLRIVAMADEAAPTRRDVPRPGVTRPVSGRGPALTDPAPPTAPGAGSAPPTGRDPGSGPAAGVDAAGSPDAAVPAPAPGPEPASSAPEAASTGQVVGPDPASGGSPGPAAGPGPDPWAEPSATPPTSAGPDSGRALPAAGRGGPEPDGQERPEPTSHAALLERARQERDAASPQTGDDEGLGEIDPDDPEVGEQSAEELLRTMLGAEVVDDDQ